MHDLASSTGKVIELYIFTLRTYMLYPKTFASAQRVIEGGEELCDARKFPRVKPSQWMHAVFLSLSFVVMMALSILLGMLGKT